MNKEKFLELHKQYSEDSVGLSYIDRKHPAYIELQTNIDIDAAVPWILERIKDSIGNDSGENFDSSNDVWLSFNLAAYYTNNKCFEGIPKECSGVLDDVRDWVLRWGESEGLI